MILIALTEQCDWCCHDLSQMRIFRSAEKLLAAFGIALRVSALRCAAATATGKAMSGYRCYILDAEDHILQAYELDCRTDVEAASSAERLLDRDPYHRTAEVWRSTQRIARVHRDLRPRANVQPERAPPLGSLV